MIARNRVFVVPVCLDATPEAAADVPRVVSAGAVDAPAQRDLEIELAGDVRYFVSQMPRVLTNRGGSRRISSPT